MGETVMSSQTTPVSIIIPVYNGVELLREALSSAFSQDPAPAEVIVVDDGSPDRPDRVLVDFPDVIVIRQENRGVGAARNAGLERASAPYVLFLDQDDRLLPGALKMALDELETLPEAAFSSGRNRPVRADGTPWEADVAPRPRVASDHYREILLDTWICPPSTVLFRRQALLSAGRWSEDLRYAGADDYELYLRITRQYPIVDHEGVIADYRMHAGNTSRDAGAMLTSISNVLLDERPYTCGDRRLERARRAGLRMWRARLELKSSGQDLAHALRDRRRIGRAAAGATAMIGRHPVYFSRLLADHLSRSASRSGESGTVRAIAAETRRKLG
jgi:glycosyltransferase involved in cell wall biosynthesis